MIPRYKEVQILVISFFAVFMNNCGEDHLSRRLDMNVIQERTTCVFKGSKSLETCQSYGKKCEGIGTCNVQYTASLNQTMEWYSSCGGKHKTKVDGVDEKIEFDCSTTTPVTENVRCYFEGSTKTQTCNSVKGSCQGIVMCSTIVKGKEEGQILWSSSCVGTHTVTLKGNDRHLQFTSCGEAKGSEVVTCVFKNSTSKQTCVAASSSKKETCTDTTKCTVKIEGKVGTVVVWKNWCTGGKYVYTLIDGKDEEAVFNCI